MVDTIQEVNILEAYMFGRNTKDVLFKTPEVNENGFAEYSFVGFDNWDEAIDPYNDENIEELTNQKFIEWENQRLNDLEEEEEVRVSINNELNSYSVTRKDYALALELLNLITKFYMDGNTISLDDAYEEFTSRLIGTNFQTPIINYITMITGITNFGTTILPDNKRRIITNACDFIRNYVIVYYGKKLE